MASHIFLWKRNAILRSETVFDHLTDAEKEKLGVDDFESFKDVPKDVIKEIDVKSKEALKRKIILKK